MSDEVLALSILQKAVTECVLMEADDMAGPDRWGIGLIDSSWFDLTQTEAALLHRLRREFGDY